MARDAFEAQKIWKEQDLKIIGPPTTTEGLYSGVFYYYLLSLPYCIGNGDPKAAAIFLSFLNALAIIPIFLLARDLFKSTPLAFLAAVFFTFSFEAIQYAPWLSNPSPAIFTVAMFFYSLRVWQKGKIWGLPLVVIFAALSAQLEFFLTFLFVVILAFKFIFNIKVQVKQFFLSIILTLVIMGSFLISMIKFNTFGKVFLGLFSISQNSEINFRIKFTDLLLNYLDRYSNLFINNLFPANVFIGGVLGFTALFFLIKGLRKESNKFILFCMLCNLPIFLFGGQNSNYTTVGMVTPAILGVVVLLQGVIKKSIAFGIIIIVAIIFANLYMTFKFGPNGQTLFVIPKDMVLENQLKLIDETYKISDGQPFSINTLTLPLWTNTTWAYLYSWYGYKKYGYVPSFYGHNQIGLLGEKNLLKIDKPLNKTFFIIEPHIGIRDKDYKLEIGSENSKTDLISETKYGELILQYRKPKNE